MQLPLHIPKVAKAFEFMVISHNNQMYGDFPYFTHPLAVAESLRSPSEDRIIMALLHDVVEDTDVSLEVIGATFGGHISKGVSLLTKDKSLTYKDNINRIIDSNNRDVWEVKWADNLCNMSGDKSKMPKERRDRLNRKYAESFEMLSKVLRY